MRRRVLLFAAGACVWLLPRGAAAQQINFQDFESFFSEPVTASATGKPERVSATAVTMDIITAEDIRRSGARDIPTLLERLAGIDVLHASPFNQSVTIEGYNNPPAGRTMVLLDGRQVYIDVYGTTLWSALPVELDEIRQIEVVKGPQCAVYGFNAVDGVINIITFDPLDHPSNSLRASYGSEGLYQAAAMATQKIGDDVALRLSGGVDYHRDTGLIEVSPVDDSYRLNPVRRSVALDTTAVAGDDFRANLQVAHNDYSDRGLSVSTLYNQRMQTDSVKAEATDDSPAGLLTGKVTYTSFGADFVNVEGFNSFTFDDREGVLQLSDLFKVDGGLTIRLGLEKRLTSMEVIFLPYGDIHEDITAASAMWDWQPSQSVSWVNAVRYDILELSHSGALRPGSLYDAADYNRDVFAYSVDSDLVYRVGPADALRFNFGRGVQLPSLYDFSHQSVISFPFLTINFEGNPRLDPTINYDYRGSWDHRFDDWGVTSRLEIFHKMTNALESTLYVATGPETLENHPCDCGGGSVSDGIEVSIEHKSATGWQWGANYSFQRINDHDPIDTVYGNLEPVNKANLHLGYGWGAYEADFYDHVSSGFVDHVELPDGTFPPVRLKAFQAPGARLAWKPSTGVVVELVVENALSYRDDAVQRTDRSGYASVRVDF